MVEDKETQVYLAGSIRRNKHAKEDFGYYQQVLEEHHYKVVNPYKFFPESIPDHMQMLLCLPLVKSCSIIYLQPGWEHSNGSLIEALYAARCGLRIVTDIKVLTQGGSDDNGQQGQGDILDRIAEKVVENLEGYINGK